MDVTGMSLEDRIAFHQRRVLIAETYENLVKGEGIEDPIDNVEVAAQINAIKQLLEGHQSTIQDIVDQSAVTEESRRKYAEELAKGLQANRDIDTQIASLQSKLESLLILREENKKHFTPQIENAKNIYESHRISLNTLLRKYKELIESKGFDFDVALQFLPPETLHTKVARKHKESPKDWFLGTKTWGKWKQFFDSKRVIIVTDPTNTGDDTIVDGETARQLFGRLTKIIC